MFKLPGLPSPHDDVPDLADFLECEALRKGAVSASDAARAIGIIHEDDHDLEHEDPEDRLSRRFEDVFAELDRRGAACGKGATRYPFDVARHGWVLRARDRDSGDPFHWLYLLMLLATRLNMTTRKTQAGIDATLLFEEVCACVAADYLGARAERFVFGTASDVPGFKARVSDLCTRLREGGGFCNRNLKEPTAQDDKVDVVVWKPFTDARSAQLIGMGQCKTGTSWGQMLAQLQPEAFCRKWMHDSPVVPPVRLFFLTEALDNVCWQTHAIDAGLLFDRCRLLDYAHDLPPELSARVQTWTQAAMELTDFTTEP